MNPAEGMAVRGLARRLGRSASTVSEILAALRGADWVDGRHRVAGKELFWQVAHRWPDTRADLVRLPVPGDAIVNRSLRLGLDDAERTAGWALTDSAAAAAYGAPLVVSTGQMLDFYVPDKATAWRATTLLGAAPSRVTATADLDPESGRARLSYEMAEQLFKEHSGSRTLHRLRHSRLTYLGEQNVGATARR